MLHQVTLQNIDRHQLTQFAKSLIDRLPSSLVIGLVGTLGAGKTTLVQQIMCELGVDPSDVTSPTFTLVQSYQVERDSDDNECCSPRRVHHLDAYRLSDDDEFVELGVDEMFEEPAAWTIVEWADRVDDAMPRSTLWIQMELGNSAETRNITLRGEVAEVHLKDLRIEENG